MTRHEEGHLGPETVLDQLKKNGVTRQARPEVENQAIGARPKWRKRSWAQVIPGFRKEFAIRLSA